MAAAAARRTTWLDASGGAMSGAEQHEQRARARCEQRRRAAARALAPRATVYACARADSSLSPRRSLSLVGNTAEERSGVVRVERRRNRSSHRRLRAQQKQRRNEQAKSIDQAATVTLSSASRNIHLDRRTTLFPRSLHAARTQVTAAQCPWSCLPDRTLLSRVTRARRCRLHRRRP